VVALAVWAGCLVVALAEWVACQVVVALVVLSQVGLRALVVWPEQAALALGFQGLASDWVYLAWFVAKICGKNHPLRA
jgi:hypothetical protein